MKKKQIILICFAITAVLLISGCAQERKELSEWGAELVVKMSKGELFFTVLLASFFGSSFSK